MADLMKPPKAFKEQQLNKSKGILDDHANRKSIVTREGSVTRVPVADIDIVNKLYVDGKLVESFPTSLTAGSVVFSDGTNLNQDNANFFWNDINKRLGIGTATPLSKLSIVSPDNSVFTDIIKTTFNAAGNYQSGIGVVFNASTAASNSMWFRVCDKTTTGQVVPLALDGSGRVIMTAGNVGIGTPTPTNKLEVLGTAPSLLKISDGTINVESQFWSGYATFGTGTASDLRLRTSNVNRLNILAGGNVGIGTITPTTKLSVNELTGMTAIGGFAIKLTNKTGANSVAGGLVKVYVTTAIDDAVMLSAADELESFGVFLDSGVSDGSEAWVVVSGIADVAMENNTLAARGNWVRSSIIEAGYSDATNAAAPGHGIGNADIHFHEIGHCIESVAAGGVGTHILARCVLHFN